MLQRAFFGEPPLKAFFRDETLPSRRIFTFLEANLCNEDLETLNGRVNFREAHSE